MKPPRLLFSSQFSAAPSQRGLHQEDENTSETHGGLAEGEQKVVSIRTSLTKPSPGDQKTAPKTHTHAQTHADEH